MVRVPKLPLSTTASENCAPSIGALVDPDTGYPSLLHSVDDCEARASGVPVFDRGPRISWIRRSLPRTGRPPATRFASPRYVVIQLSHARETHAPNHAQGVDTRGAATQP